MALWLKKIFLNRRAKPAASHLQLGARGEQVAIEYLKEYEGYRIVATNFLVPVGRGLRGQKVNAEIDLIAYDAGQLVFIEVKTRTSDAFIAPERAVDLRKQRQIARAARRYRKLMGVSPEPYRYDVVTVVPQARRYKIELLRNYFDDRIFRNARYFRRD